MSESVRAFDIRRIAFAYEENPEVAKERPVIVAHVSRGEALVLAVKVTGHGPRLGFPGEVRLADWEQAGLSKPSVARCSKVATIPLSIAESSALYGHLSPRDEEAVVRGLCEAGIV